MMSSITYNKKKITLLKIASILLLILIWWVVALISNKKLVLHIPTPLDTILSLIQLFWKDYYWTSIVTTIWHILLGFVIAFILGSILGYFSGKSIFFKELSRPWLHLMKTIPVSALIILAWLWIPSTILPSIISSLMVIPIIWSHTEVGVFSLNPKLEQMGKSFGLKKGELIFQIELPQMKSSIVNGAITGFGIAWKSGIAAEVITNPTGSLGALLQRAKATIEYSEVFAIILTIVLLSLLFEFAIKLLVGGEKK